MKKTQWIDLWTTIRRNRIPYLAIIIFVALGIALYAGMSWVCTYIDSSMTQTCNEGRLAHLRVVYPYGISEEQMDELLQIDGVDDAEGYNFIYRFFELDGKPQQAAVYQLTEHIGTPTVVSGTMPAAENEIAVLSSWAERNNVHLGDTIVFEENYGSDYREVLPAIAIAAWNPESGEAPDTDISNPGYLKTNTFTITAFVDSPEYILTTKSGYGSNLMNGDQLDAIMFVSKAAMDPELFHGYTAAAIYSESLAEKNDGSATYDAAYEELETSVTELTETWTEIPDSYRDVLTHFSRLLENAAKQISDAITQINGKQEELDEGQAAVKEGENTLAEKQQEYNAGAAELAQKQAEYDSAEAQLEDGWAAYDCVLQDINAASVLMNDIDTFLQIMDESNASEEQTPAEDQTNVEESTPGEDTEPSHDEKMQAAMDAVRGSAGNLCGLLSAQRSMLLSQMSAAGVSADIDGAIAACQRLENCETAEQIRAEVDAACDAIESAISKVENLPDKMLKTLNSFEAELNSARGQLDWAYAQLSAAYAQLEAGRKQLEDARKELAEGQLKLQAARAELKEKQTEYQDAQTNYQQIDAAAESVYEVMPAVLTRSSNISLASADGIVEVFRNARTTLASLFLIVAVLVGYSTLARMVADTSLQIGTKKALGFSRWETLRLYLLYAFTAALIGAMLGTAGAVGVETIFNRTFLDMYQVKELPAVIQPLPVLLPFIAELVLLTIVVALAALRELNRKTIDLLKGTSETAAPQNRPARFCLFRSMPLLDRIILTNLRQDKRRVIAMLIGIGGSAMLITAGLTCLINMSQSSGVQYSRYYQFDTIVRYDSSEETASAELRALLDSYDVPYAEIYYTHVLTDDRNGYTRIPDTFVPVDLEELSGVMHFANENGKNSNYTGGLWIADSYYEKQGYRTGETIQLQTLTGDTAELPISGFYKNYVPSITMVIDMETWLSVYPNTTPNAYLVNTAGIDTGSLQADLSGLDGYIYSIPYRDNSESSFNVILGIIAAISAIFLVMAVLLLLMLLINLLDMYITEKKRELIILKINGYPSNKVKQYIWKDTLLLTIAGIIIGTALGTVDGNFTQSSLEGSTMLMVHGISWTACAVAAAVTALTALVITLFELRKIDCFHLSDINS